MRNKMVSFNCNCLKKKKVHSNMLFHIYSYWKPSTFKDIPSKFFNIAFPSICTLKEGTL